VVEADELSAQADGKRREADKHEARTEELLEQLRAHEDVDGDVEYAVRQPWDQSGTVKYWPRTRTAVLRGEAGALEERAAALAARRVRDAGGISGVGVDELLARFAELGPDVVAPPVDEVLAWATTAVSTARWPGSNRHSTGLPPIDPAKVVLELVWRDGHVDVDASTAQPVHEAHAV
jgi:hypothetical protein